MRVGLHPHIRPVTEDSGSFCGVRLTVEQFDGSDVRLDSTACDGGLRFSRTSPLCWWSMFCILCKAFLTCGAHSVSHSHTDVTAICRNLASVSSSLQSWVLNQRPADNLRLKQVKPEVFIVVVVVEGPLCLAGMHVGFST